LSTEYLNNKLFEEVIGRFQQSKKEKVRYEVCIEDLEGAIERGNDGIDYILKLNKFVHLHSTAASSYSESQQQLALAFLTLSENIVRYAKFNLIDMDDAIQEGVMICFEKIDRFDPRKGKGFNYFTTCLLNHLRQLYRTARNYDQLKFKYLVHLEEKVDNCLKTQRKITIYKPNS
jgi:DNA-directed RNA polymerase sigma subunit (sigma70/sigma32)